MKKDAEKKNLKIQTYFIIIHKIKTKENRTEQKKEEEKKRIFFTTAKLRETLPTGEEKKRIFFTTAKLRRNTPDWEGLRTRLSSQLTLQHNVAKKQRAGYFLTNLGSSRIASNSAERKKIIKREREKERKRKIAGKKIGSEKKKLHNKPNQTKPNQTKPKQK